MKIFFDKHKLQKIIYKEKKLGFVPTMGALHLGHISLIKKCAKMSSKTIVSIFVNKPQFNRKADFGNYPRDLKRDILMLKKLKVDYLFIPSNKQIYPRGPNKNIKVHSFSKKLCGEFRANHFEAIADVIDRFIQIIKPKKIFFGNKDMQQLKIVENFVKKKYPEINIIGCKTIREKNGIAYSSRNLLLSNNDKKIASKIYKILSYQKNKVINKKISINKIKTKIIKLGIKKIDYLKLLNINKLIEPFKKRSKYKIFIAYYIGSVRLIDNI